MRQPFNIPVSSSFVMSLVHEARVDSVQARNSIDALEGHMLQTNNEDLAVEFLTRSIELAQPGGFMRLFVDLGQKLNPLLQFILNLFDRPVQSRLGGDVVTGGKDTGFGHFINHHPT